MQKEAPAKGEKKPAKGPEKGGQGGRDNDGPGTNEDEFGNEVSDAYAEANAQRAIVDFVDGRFSIVDNTTALIFM